MRSETVQQKIRDKTGRPDPGKVEFRQRSGENRDSSIGDQAQDKEARCKSGGVLGEARG